MPDAISIAEKVVLHVGCGRWRPDALHFDYQKPGWREIRLDVNPDVKPDVVASMTDMGVVESCSIDAVWTSHSLEHLYAHEVPIALEEFHRVLRPGGHLFIRLPDVQKVAELILQVGLTGVAYESAAGPITPLDMLYGHRSAIERGECAMQHKTGFTEPVLSRAIAAAGFPRARVVRHVFDLWARAFK